MREHGVKRILAMSTPSADEPQDRFHPLMWFFVLIVRLIVPAAYQAVRAIAKVFKEEAQGLDWTVFRIAGIPGGHDEASWQEHRKHNVYAGYVADGSWKQWTYRGSLARWLADSAEGQNSQWIGKLPAISDGGKRDKAD
jgi:hypothetical protein